jgi:hypothetical protein
MLDKAARALLRGGRRVQSPLGEPAQGPRQRARVRSWVRHQPRSVPRETGESRTSGSGWRSSIGTIPTHSNFSVLDRLSSRASSSTAPGRCSPRTSIASPATRPQPGSTSTPRGQGSRDGSPRPRTTNGPTALSVSRSPGSGGSRTPSPRRATASKSCRCTEKPGRGCREEVGVADRPLNCHRSCYEMPRSERTCVEVETTKSA